MRNVSDKSCREKQNIHFVFIKFFLKIVLLNEIMWKKMATDDNITWRMRIACWITKATNTHSQ